MPILDGKEQERQGLMETANFIVVSARKSPKSGGVDDILTSVVYGAAEAPLPRYCIGEKAAGVMILFAWVSRRPAPPPGGHTPVWMAVARTFSRWSRLA